MLYGNFHDKIHYFLFDDYPINSYILSIKILHFSMKKKSSNKVV